MASSESPPPSKMARNTPWEVLVHVAPDLDPETLAVASCVSKSWNAAFSSDHLWRRICLSWYPSSLHLMASHSPRRLFALLRAASRRRRPVPAAPRISLNDLIFTVDVFRKDDAVPLISLAKCGGKLSECFPRCGIFRFDVGVGAPGGMVEAEEELRVVWMVVKKGLDGAFVMMDAVGKGRIVGESELWLSEELPSSGCCGTAAGCSGSGGLQSEVWIEFSGCDEGAGGGGGHEAAGVRRRRRVGRVSLGLMSIAAWRYVSVKDGLLYLQRYLLPDNG